MTHCILIVDDSRTTLEVIKVHLMSLGYDFVSAANAADGYEMARQLRPDIIISDMAMPDMTGIELCKKIRAHSELQAIPFVVVTAKKEDHVRRDAFAAGVDGFVRKPIEPARLRLLVTELLSRPRSAAGPR
jgi:CheY-like chemotaxis protein